MTGAKEDDGRRASWGVVGVGIDRNRIGIGSGEEKIPSHTQELFARKGSVV